MAHSRTWGYARGLDEACRVVVGVEHVDIVPGGFSYETAKDVEFSAGGSGGRKCMTVAWKW